MSLPDVEITELQNAIGIVPPGSDDVQVVMGCSSKGPTLGLAAFGTADGLVNDHGHGPAVEAAALSLNETGTPVIFIRLPSSVAGVLGALVVSGFTGTAVPSGSGTPVNTFEGYWLAKVGGELGTPGIVFQWALDNGRTPSAETPLGTAFSFTFPDSGVTLAFDPPAAQVTALIALAVELRTDILAHLANVTAHDAADTSAAQVALAASSAPTTGAEAWAVLNLCRDAWAAHLLDIAAHNGQDATNTVSHAAATSEQTGIDLAIELKADVNAHLAVALAASPAGLKTATATVAATVTLTASDLLSAGLALMATYPRRVSITTAGVTASDAPATATIVGTDYADAAQSETFNVGQTATTVFSTKAFKTITTVSHPAADGTGATLAYGYGQAVHNSADVTNTIAAAAPTHGTIVAGDKITFPTTEPKPVAQDITDAMAVLKSSQQSWGFIQLVTPCDASMAAALGTALDAHFSDSKFRGRAAIISTRTPNAGETGAQWRASIKANFASWTRTDVMICAGYWWQSSAVKAARYLRPIGPAVAARAAAVDFWIDLAKVALGALDTGTLFDSNGALIGHDERENPDLDAAGFCTFRTFSTKGQAVYITNPRLHSQAGSDFDYWQKRRVMNVLEAVVYDTSLVLTLSAEGETDGAGHISDTAATDIESDMRTAITAVLGPAISNPGADELFVLSRTDPVLTNGGEMNASSRARPLFYIKKLKVKVGFTATAEG